MVAVVPLLLFLLLLASGTGVTISFNARAVSMVASVLVQLVKPGNETTRYYYLMAYV